ncbi:3-keto-disaccharide hydrolase [Tuwongella immobilis]|uniref:3-keto-alpha-glucoside-1,2-lyase/3-keto-2-hydroxy-glucal hydratase domain-containing protein n=1 Tax=Tuwongella immobilis TaxID=692036 RepID=A0A6C2YQ32_9BACT|nr:DUF1080 domain-containing protein [Tuwongella immobilis]VIP03457.1 Secreted glycosyl hydrolase OS=uncultured planctomycete GN=HGMM_F11G08C09 PE=4 SV=1: DUF1080 [Tuwongella immobilis]VTS04286.1 Secreted glycosyl hydrolase OS=uncultured planctomycete GN=HGMM_F11G08C09 PE=4 SV=1: DUF1080 [Tuwongella immobilis]
MSRHSHLLALLALPLLLAANTPQPLQLLDGESTFGWTVSGTASLASGKLVLGPGKAVAQHDIRLPKGEIVLVYSLPRGTATADQQPLKVGDQLTQSWAFAGGKLRLTTGEDSQLSIHSLTYTPIAGQSLFDGKSLAGWTVFPDRKSKFTVTPEGWLNVIDGPGDLQTVGQWDDFLFQTECISNGQWLNSGIFFRAIPGQYQQGYEAQIRNQWVGNDRSKPFDFGTGAIYRRQPARKVVSTDKEWFTLTIVADGNHIATWVNGIQVADFTDSRATAANARQGSKTTAGILSIQGHDPTTDLSFRNLRVVPLNEK